jgi:sigma-B regulation protein RsbU (phosphoserine phosphatase)
MTAVNSATATVDRDPTQAGRRGAGAVHWATVLVVDDMEVNRDLLRRRLARMGVSRILEAGDGAAALEVIRTAKIDLVLLDIMMPVMTGFDVLEALAVEGRIEQLPVIVISALNEMDSTVRAIELGAEDFLLKPFEPTLLRARVGAILEKQLLRVERRETLARAQAELAEARSLQLALTPPPHQDASTAIQVILEPAREVGGDLVDHMLLPDGRRLLALGDVSGKGAGAALMMARTHALIRSLAHGTDAAALFDDLGAVASTVNVALAAGNANCTFITLVLALFDPVGGRLTYVRCGHIPPFLRRAGGDVERLEGTGGLPLGVIETAKFTPASVPFGEGDSLLLLSDGITEAISPEGEFFDEDRVTRWFAGRDQSLIDLMDRVRRFEDGAPAADDVSLLLFRLLSPETAKVI